MCIRDRQRKEKVIMDKNTCTRIKLGKGEMHLYECGKLRLHAYKTNDFMDDEVFLLEKDGRCV